MRLETIPVILGILFVLAGLAVVADAAIPDGALLRPERRRSPRPQRHLVGEAALGVGIVCVGAGLIGRDAWPYTTVAFLAAFVFCTIGVVLNWRYVRGMMLVNTDAEPDAAGQAARGPAPGTSAEAAPPAPSAAAPPTAPTSDGGQRPERRMHARSRRG